MGAEAKIVSPLSIPVLDVQYRRIAQGTNLTKIEDVVEISSPRTPVFHQIHSSESVLATDISRPDADVRSPDKVCHGTLGSAILQFVPNIRSGSCAEIGPRRFMEDEHIRIDDLSSHLGSLFKCPTPSAFYGVFDGHEGPDAAAYVRRNMIRFIFEEADFPQTSEINDVFIGEVENSLRKAYLLADIALADDGSVSSSSGTTALTALVFGRHLLVANAGDCRAVLCRKGEAIEMSQDHRPICPSERRRVEELGGSVDAGGYLNGTLSVSRALGDWKMKFPRGSPSPLIAEPEFRQAILTEDDEFLIIGCDGIWDVMSSQKAVGLVRRGLRRHDDPEQCAKDLVTEAMRLNAFDNITVIVVCFSSSYASLQQRQQRRRCILSPDAVRSLMSLLNGV